mmetsp:Transcript_122974/g.358934  ORF Transcript_122974/g.358934 Transcript_122974/m.358934 type:complete len:295 (+) Transcript_122974:64-948(+)
MVSFKLDRGALTCCNLARLAVLAVLALLCLAAFKVASCAAFATGEAAHEIFRHRQNLALPDHLRGVMWMAGNTGPELLMSFEAGAVDVKRRAVSIIVGEDYSWSYNADLWGFTEYVLVSLSWTLLGAGRLEFQFDDEWREAQLRLTRFGRTAAHWYVEQIDSQGHTFVRGRIAQNGRKVPAYTLLKVIDHLGRPLPAFALMTTTDETGRPVGVAVEDIPNITVYPGYDPARPKTYRQIEHTYPGIPAVMLGLLMVIGYGMCCAVCLRDANILQTENGFWNHPSCQTQPLYQGVP